MKETTVNKSHMQIVKDRSLMQEIFAFHMKERYLHLVNLKDQLKATRSGKKTVVWGLVKEALATLPEYQALDSHGKLLCERETSRHFKRSVNVEAHMREWEKNHKSDPTPPVDDDYSAINALFSKATATPPTNTEIAGMVSLAKEGAKTIKSPSGWVVEF
jgi:hypothetical protein